MSEYYLIARGDQVEGQRPRTSLAVRYDDGKVHTFHFEPWTKQPASRWLYKSTRRLEDVVILHRFGKERPNKAQFNAAKRALSSHVSSVYGTSTTVCDDQNAQGGLA